MSQISSTGITTSSGLISGIPIEDTVDQLIQVASAPMNRLQNRTQGLAAEQAAVDQLATLTLGVQFSLTRLRSASTYNARTATSSDRSALGVSLASSGTPAIGSYDVTPLSQSTPHQLVSGRIDDIASLGGALSFGFGGHVDKGVALSELTTGFTAGQIKITDADGVTEQIDLRGAQTIDDVLDAINSAEDIDVTASASGDRLVLTDNSGGDGTLRVREVSGGQTAESLGLLETSVDGVLTGADIYGLTASTSLNELNDGLGVRFDSDQTADIRITLADGSSAEIDLSEAEDLGDVLDAINAADGLGGALTAAINAEGDGLTLTDTTTGGSLVIEDLGDGSVATDLGIATAGASGTLEGGRLVAGLKDTLVSSLDAGAGLTLGEIQITDRTGAGPTTVDLSSAETLGEIVDLINASGAGVEASINSSRNGIEIADTSGGSGSLVIANGGAGTTADDLGITVDAAVSSIDSGSLGRQSVGEATRLEDFNGGQGVALGNFRITDSSGASTTIRLNTSGDEAETIGDVIDRINDSGLGVEARINDTGDGILLTDTADGSGTLSVEEVGSGTAAADLGLLGDSSTTDDQDSQTIDGSTRTTIDLSGIDGTAEGIRLSSLNGGEGIGLGIFQVTAADGSSFSVDLGVSESDVETIGDVIDRINAEASAAGVSVTARINDNESGIVLEDTSGGDGELTVADLGSGSAADQLNLVRTAADTDDNEIDGAGLFTFDGDNSLNLLAQRINEAGAGVTASVFADGDGYRLSLTTDESGSANELLVDGLGAGVSFSETVRPGDAVALFGGVGGVGGFALTSTDGRFENVLDGLSLTVNQPTGETVQVNVAANTSTAVNAVESFVSAYNSLRDSLASFTSFDAEAETTGLLFGRNEALRVDTELSTLLTDSYFVGDEFTSLQQIGLSVDQDGQLSLDEAKFLEALEQSPTAVEDLFRDEERGVLARFDDTIDRLAGDEDSLLANRSQAIGATIDNNNERISTMTESLERQREALLLEFIGLEEAIASMQNNLSAIEDIQLISLSS